MKARRTTVGPVSAFSTPHDAAQAVQSCARHTGVDLWMLPFQPLNRTAPWWLSPNKENPGYRYGKVIFCLDQIQPSQLFVGLYLEKGIGPDGEALYCDSKKGRRYIMDDDWRERWRGHLDAMANSALDSGLREVERKANGPVVVEIDAGHVPPPVPGEPDERVSFPREVAAFEWSAGRLTPREYVTSPDRLLASLAAVTSLGEMAAKLRTTPDVDRVWIDTAFGLRLLLADDPRRQTAWDDAALWERAVAPWVTWLR